MIPERACGILLHPTSLSGDGGIGTLGAPARRFIDFLRDAGQTYWQMLPLCPPARENSPYEGLSALAGNPLLLDLQDLVQDGLLAALSTSPKAKSTA